MTIFFVALCVLVVAGAVYIGVHQHKALAVVKATAVAPTVKVLDSIPDRVCEFRYHYLGHQPRPGVRLIYSKRTVAGQQTVVTHTGVVDLAIIQIGCLFAQRTQAAK